MTKDDIDSLLRSAYAHIDVDGSAKLVMAREEVLIDKIYVDEKKKTTVVAFEDGTKEKVKLEEGGSFDVYNAVAICIAKRVYGSNSAFKKAIKDNVTYQMSKERRLSTERLRKNIQRAIDKMAKISR